jgi:hypothetical protein
MTNTMENKTFTIQYNRQTLQVQQSRDANHQVFYSIQFPGGRTIDLYTTPVFDGMASGWADETGQKTEQARKLGELIQQKIW